MFIFIRPSRLELVTVTYKNFVLNIYRCHKNCGTVRYGSNVYKSIYLIANITGRDTIDDDEEFTWTCMNETSKQILLNSNIRKTNTTQDVFILKAGALKDNKNYTITAISELKMYL